jgi:hypothetical protein
LELLASFSGEDRFDDMRTDELLGVAIEKKAMLLAQLNDTGETKMRAVWISPVDEDLRQALQMRGEPVVDFRDGVVTVASERQIEEPPFTGQQTRVVYVDAGQFYEDVSDLSAPQLQRRLEERFAADKAIRDRERTDHLNWLRLEQTLLRRIVHQRAAKENLPLGREVERQIKLDTEALRNQLAQSQTWVERGVDTPAIKRLIEAEGNIVADVRLLLALAQRSGDEYLLGRLGRILEVKRADRARLAPVAR